MKKGLKITWLKNNRHDPKPYADLVRNKYFKHMLITILNTAFYSGLQNSMNTIYDELYTSHLLNCLKHAETIEDGGGN